MNSFVDPLDSYEWQEDVDYSFYRTYNGVPTLYTMRDFYHNKGLPNPSCVVMPLSPNAFLIRSGMLQQLPNFHGLDHENSFTRVELFLEIVGFLLEENQWEEEVKLRLFAYTLHSNA